MGRVLAVVVVICLTIFCVVEVAQASPDEVRRAPRWLWAVAVICLPLVGSLAWLALGRPNAESIAEAERDRHPSAPDDDPDFLRRL
ncbi:PLD nuclease N-terminal domain-containing protein [Mariniluteicoccus endophyticus]